MYAKCARAADASRAFREMTERNALSWCSLLHAFVVSGHMELAHELFDEMPTRSNVAWNTLLMGHSRSGNAKQCLALFNEMRMSGLTCDDATLCILIDACAELPNPSNGFAIHKTVVQSGWNDIPEVNNSLISFYAKFNLLDYAVQIFECMKNRTTASWNSLIDAHARLGYIEQAAALFESAPETNVISWTAMIGGFARNGSTSEALALFVKMTQEHIHPDDFAFGAVLHACASAPCLASGRMVHTCAFRSGFASYLYVANSLMDMYAKCGDVEGATNVFDAIHQKDLVSWNTMLFGFAINGLSKEALAVYESMSSHNISPDEVTFTGLLTACSHSGLLEQGRAFFESMMSVHEVQPKPVHFSCVLDMYARSGNIAKAIEMMEHYPEIVKSPGSDLSEALLSFCSSENLDAWIGRKVGDSVVATAPARDTGYVMLSNLLCASGQWDEAERMRRAMAEQGVKKSPGCSWIEVKGKVKVFVSGEEAVDRIDSVYGVIYLLDYEMRNSVPL
uniref:DYW domain-containing protein n=2 Tax=Oryza brachyantha TaxID=4533 RepID=J3MZA5_ORYBR